MDIYGMSSAGQDFLGVDELFDFSDDRDDLFSSSTTTAATDAFHNITSSTASASQFQYIFNNNNNTTTTTTTTNYHHSTDFTDHFCVPNDEVAELEWLSKFVDDSSSDFPANNIAGTINFRPENTSIHSRSRSKRTRAPSNNNSWTSTPVPTTQISETSKTKRETYSSTTSSSCDTTSETGIVRRCTHCASEKTPQWRTGPLGPKTLCNACGVRYKSGRLVPEYRPAASPTFVLTQHSNSHRKVMELRRQKEMILGHHHHQQQQHLPPSEHQLYGGGHHHHHHRQQQQRLHHGSNYEVC
ncbi:GATA transcription factor 4-like [Cynara cardunculus var. scolymus]|uniref:GATA transcription factor n=1 Tax=Cynara cardunculus var. scolymus TaxID=59895 RepID=A0A118JUI0_CYNCS|nr:GATA transcription factor 4-like [Cynara cardunculus var. scolymus]KVH91212.1 Transcription factor, GATA, plant [Cynara cardunculus var. scolymus]